MANSPIKTYKGTSSYLSTIANTNGNLLFDTDKKEIFLDDGTNRESYGGGSATVISYADFSQLTPQQQESGNYLVTGMPALTNAYNVEYKNGVDVGTELDNLNTDLNNVNSGLVSVGIQANQNSADIRAINNEIRSKFSIGVEKVTFSLTQSDMAIIFNVSATELFAITFYDTNSIVYAHSIDGGATWTNVWTK